MSGQYASYWNAFLSEMSSHHILDLKLYSFQNMKNNTIKSKN